ncbi:39766_t:CDS:1, partial [Gigaspora margarita]
EKIHINKVPKTSKRIQHATKTNKLNANSKITAQKKRKQAFSIQQYTELSDIEPSLREQKMFSRGQNSEDETDKNNQAMNTHKKRRKHDKGAQ